MPFPFEVPFEQLGNDLNPYVDAVFSALQSEFMTLPKGEGFVDYPVFEQGYEALKHATSSFRRLAPDDVLAVVNATPIALIVLRSMLGFTPPEWAYVASQRNGIEVTQGAARTLDRLIRLKPLAPIGTTGLTADRIRALVFTACELLAEGAPDTPPERLHRLDKADTTEGIVSLKALSDLGVPYSMLLYERYLGRPFAGHRDSVSELVGDVLESAIENALVSACISFRKTRRAERVTGFDQAPDFIIPNEFNPQVVIEAKITEDDGTARDKVTRVQHLGSLSLQGVPPGGQPRFQVVACIAGRGFGVRREDMRKLILATRGKVFTLRNLDRLVECTDLRHYSSM
jgi:hypothetical protein